MGRSLKKGPFVDDHLINKIEKLNETDSKQVVKLGLVVQLSSLSSLVIQLLYMTVVNMYQFMLLKTW